MLHRQIAKHKLAPAVSLKRTDLDGAVILAADPNDISPGIPVVVVIEGWGKGSVYPLVKDCVTIGRMTSCDIRLAPQEISRVHALIMRTAQGYDIENHAHGDIFVNEDRIAGQVRLGDGDQIRFCNIILRYEARCSASMV